MSRIPFIRRLAALTIVLALALPWTAAAAPHAPGRLAAAESSLARLWSWLTSLWGDNGCGIDPDGSGCVSRAGASSAPPPSPDNGCGLDPNGSGCIPGTGSAPAPSTDNGCAIDPHGGGCTTGG